MLLLQLCKLEQANVVGCGTLHYQLWNSDVGRWDSDWRDDRLGLGAAPEHPDSDTRAEEEREDVGDDDRVEELGFPLGAAEHAAVLGRGLGGRAAAAAGAPPRLGRRDVGARAPVPDEVRDLRVAGVAVAQRVDVDITETSYL